MRLRPYIAALDYDTVASWVTDERLHAMWCARRFPYPLTREGFDESLADMAERLGSSAFVATDDAGKVIGFFGYHLDPEKNEGVLKFVIVSSKLVSSSATDFMVSNRRTLCVTEP